MTRLRIVAGLAGLAACSSLPGPVAQLERFERESQAQNWAAIAGEGDSGDCQPGGSGSDACAKLHALHGRACLQLAQAEASPQALCPPATPTARSHLDCAAADLGAVQGGGGFGADQLADLTRMRGRALYCGATQRSPADGIPLARTAQVELAPLPPDPAADHLAASVALYLAQRDQLAPADRCADAKQAQALAARGLAAAPQGDVADGLQGVARNALSVASRIPDCGS